MIKFEVFLLNFTSIIIILVQEVYNKYFSIN